MPYFAEPIFVEEGIVVALARCTCIYRALPAAGQGQSPSTVITRDPFCPSAHLHDRDARGLADEPAAQPVTE